MTDRPTLNAIQADQEPSKADVVLHYSTVRRSTNSGCSAHNQNQFLRSSQSLHVLSQVPQRFTVRYGSTLKMVATGSQLGGCKHVWYLLRGRDDLNA